MSSAPTGPPSWRYGSAPGTRGTLRSLHARERDATGVDASRPAPYGGDGGVREESRVGYWFVKAILTPILRLLFRPWVEGLDNVPEDGPAILVSNHLSFSDSIFLPLVVPRRV